MHFLVDSKKTQEIIQQFNQVHIKVKSFYKNKNLQKTS